MSNETGEHEPESIGDSGDTASSEVAAAVPSASVTSGDGVTSGGLVLPSWYDTSFYDAARAAVPEIGTVWRRWYDGPYLFLGWWVSSWRSKVTPRRLRNRIQSWRMTLIHYNDHDRNKAHSRDDPMHNIAVPDGEHVTVPTLWVIELFPPSCRNELDAVWRKFKPSVQMFGDKDDAVSLLSQVRAGQGYEWLRLGEAQAPGLRGTWRGARTERLASPFSNIALTAIQLGTGLTAIIAQFRLNADDATSLNRVWHRQHEPRLSRQGKHLLPEDREWSAYSETQKARRQPHDLARDWMRQNCSGLFAQNGEAQPLMDLLVFTKHAPLSSQRPTFEEKRALRAVGITGTHSLIASPTVVPAFALAPTDIDLCPTLGSQRTWTLWANRAEALAARPGLTKSAGPDEYSALAYTANKETRDIFLALSVTDLVKHMQQKYTNLRDTARRQHDSFSSEYLQELRQTLLTLSIDLASTKIDVPSWWKRHRSHIPPFYIIDPSDHELTEDEQPEELTEQIRSRQTDDLATLSEVDATIRDILTTVASLGAASDAYSLGRKALYVAALSLAIALTTLLFTNIGTESVAAELWTWLHRTWDSLWNHWARSVP